MFNRKLKDQISSLKYDLLEVKEDIFNLQNPPQYDIGDKVWLVLDDDEPLIECVVAGYSTYEGRGFSGYDPYFYRLYTLLDMVNKIPRTCQEADIKPQKSKK